MKMYVWLLICAVVCGYADSCLATDSCSREEEFLASIGKNAPDDNSGCYYDDSSCVYKNSNGEEKIRWDYTGGPERFNCDDYTYACIYTSNAAETEGWVGIPSCCSCNPGYELKWTSVGSTVCMSSWEYYQSPSSENGKVNPGSGLSASHNICEQNCQDSNCASDTNWRSSSTGYMVRTARSCSEKGKNGICNTTSEYQCAENYYGSSTDGKTGCNPCPVWSGVYANYDMTVNVVGKSKVGSANITDCVVKQNTYYDNIGTFETNGDCVGQ